MVYKKFKQICEINTCNLRKIELPHRNNLRIPSTDGDAYFENIAWNVCRGGIHNSVVHPR